MGNAVFANGREIACKSGSGQVIASFPDVCLSPPSPPAGPVPIPYPVTSSDSDTEQGTKHVKVDGKEVMHKDGSDFKTCSGDEACTKSLGMGVVTHKQTGKVFFVAWSMDVKIEGDNAVRHLDMTTSNHGSSPGNTPPWIFKAKNGKGGVIDECKKDKEKADKACKDLNTRDEQCDPNSKKAKKCNNAKKCLLVSYKQGGRTGKKATVGCCPGETPHHMVEVHSFTESGGRKAGDRVHGFSRYNDKDAPCVCVKGGRGDKEHGAFHAIVGKRENAAVARAIKNGTNPEKAWKYKDAKKAAVKAHKKVLPASGCSEKCLEAQLDKYHHKIGATDDKDIRTGTQALEAWQKKSDAAIIKQMGKDLAGI